MLLAASLISAQLVMELALEICQYEMPNRQGGAFMKKRLFALCLVVASALVQAGDAVVLFRDSRFRGPSELVTADISDLRGHVVGNDQLGSIKIPPGCKVVLYEDINFRGRELVLDSSVKNMKHTTLGKNSASSLRLVWARESRALPERRPRGEKQATHHGNSPGDRHGRGGDSRRDRYEDQRDRHGDQRGDRHGDRHGDRAEVGITLYSHVDYAGPSISFSGDCADLNRTPVGGDRVSSLRVPPGYEVILYEGRNFQGSWESFTYDDGNLCDNRIGNDKASSLRIRQLPVGSGSEGVAGVVLFEHAGFRGKKQRVTGTLDNLKHSKIGNDRVSAVEIPRGYAVTLYAESHFKGASETLYESDRDLSDNWIGDNRVSSVRVVWLGAGRVLR